MISGEDRPSHHLFRLDVPQEKWLPVAPLHIEHLIKIAIVNFAAPANVERIAAHQARHRRRIEGIDKQPLIVFELAAAPQIGGKARDGQISDGVKMVEHDAKVFF